MTTKRISQASSKAIAPTQNACGSASHAGVDPVIAAGLLHDRATTGLEIIPIPRRAVRIILDQWRGLRTQAHTGEAWSETSSGDGEGVTGGLCQAEGGERACHPHRLAMLSMDNRCRALQTVGKELLKLMTYRARRR